MAVIYEVYRQTTTIDEAIEDNDPRLVGPDHMKNLLSGLWNDAVSEGVTPKTLICGNAVCEALMLELASAWWNPDYPIAVLAVLDNGTKPVGFDPALATNRIVVDS